MTIGNEFPFTTDEQATATLSTWDAGLRYLDVSPCTGWALPSGAVASGTAST